MVNSNTHSSQWLEINQLQTADDNDSHWRPSAIIKSVFYHFCFVLTYKAYYWLICMSYTVDTVLCLLPKDNRCSWMSTESRINRLESDCYNWCRWIRQSWTGTATLHCLLLRPLDALLARSWMSQLCLSVSLSVSHACFVTKRKLRSRYFDTTWKAKFSDTNIGRRATYFSTYNLRLKWLTNLRKTPTSTDFHPYCLNHKK